MNAYRHNTHEHIQMNTHVGTYFFTWMQKHIHAHKHNCTYLGTHTRGIHRYKFTEAAFIQEGMCAHLHMYSHDHKNVHDPQQPEKERAYFTLLLVVCHTGKSEKELKAGIWRQKLTQRHKSASSWLVSHDLFSLIFHTFQDLPAQDGTSHSQQG